MHISILIRCLYVDDLLITGNSDHVIYEFKQRLNARFEMTDLGQIQYFLGIQIKKLKAGLFISQEKYAYDLLKKYQMTECNPSLTPMNANESLIKGEEDESVEKEKYRSLIGSLLYLTQTRPDLEFTVNHVARYTNHPNMTHWLAVKCILRYIQGTKQLGLFYPKETNRELEGFSDADWGKNGDD